MLVLRYDTLVCLTVKGHYFMVSVQILTMVAVLLIIVVVVVPFMMVAVSICNSKQT